MWISIKSISVLYVSIEISHFRRGGETILLPLPFNLRGGGGRPAPIDSCASTCRDSCYYIYYRPYINIILLSMPKYVRNT